jgi:hypothetical protein
MTAFHFVVLGTQRLSAPDRPESEASHSLASAPPDGAQMRTAIQRALPALEEQLRAAVGRLRVDLGDSVLVFEPRQVRLYPLIGEPR